MSEGKVARVYADALSVRRKRKAEYRLSGGICARLLKRAVVPGNCVMRSPTRTWPAISAW